MLENLRRWLVTILGVALFAGAVVGLSECDKRHQEAVVAKVDTLMIQRHDTLVKLDTILQEKIKYIKSAPDTLIIKEFERVYVSDPDDTTKVQTTVSAERKALIVKDSLTWCLSCRSVDSATIDSLAKIGKKKEPTDWQTLGLIGAGGVVLGIILTR